MKMSAAALRRVARICAVAVIWSVPAAVHAQDPRGSITGRITDSSGGGLPGVTVTATNMATNVSSSTVTNAEGNYSILYLSPGTYSVAAELSGFKKVMRAGVEDSGTPTRITSSRAWDLRTA